MTFILYGSNTTGPGLFNINDSGWLLSGSIIAYHLKSPSDINTKY